RLAADRRDVRLVEDVEPHAKVLVLLAAGLQVDFGPPIAGRVEKECRSIHADFGTGVGDAAAVRPLLDKVGVEADIVRLEVALEKAGLAVYLIQPEAYVGVEDRLLLLIEQAERESVIAGLDDVLEDDWRDIVFLYLEHR